MLLRRIISGISAHEKELGETRWRLSLNCIDYSEFEFELNTSSCEIVFKSIEFIDSNIVFRKDFLQRHTLRHWLFLVV